MPSPIHELIQRKPANKEIDVQATLHAVAKELIAQRDEEKRIRNNRRYRTAVRAVFQANGNLPLSRAQVVRAAIAKLRVKDADRTKTLGELWEHVTFNRQHGYLRTADIGMVLASQ